MFSRLRKSLLSVALVAGLLFGLGAQPAQAALVVAQTVTANQNFPSPSPVTFTSSVASGTVIVVQMWITGLSTNNPGTITVTDNVNTGAYTQIGATYFDSYSENYLAQFYKVANATGTPTVSVSYANPNTETDMIVSQVTGWAGTPTVDPSAYQTANGGSAGGTAVVVDVSTAHANEILYATLNDSSYDSAYPSGWTNMFSGRFFNAIVASPAANNLSATLGASSNWAIMTGGLYDATGTPAPLAGSASDTTSGAATITAPGAPFVPIGLDNASRAGGSDQIGMGTGPNTGTGDTADVAFTKLKQWASDANQMLTQLYPVRSSLTPVTGFTATPAQGITQLVLNPAGTLATGTITFPQLPGDNQPFCVMSSQAITALTLNTADGTTINGAATTLAANSSIKWRFQSAANAWFREQ
jgi:hypothetical protein